MFKGSKVYKEKDNVDSKFYDEDYFTILQVSILS
jgi:hypothetical protein